MTQSEIIGSFIRTGNFPLEANYIFESELALKDWANQELIKPTLHEGLFKIVKAEDNQELWWVVNEDEELKFTKLLSSSYDILELLNDLANLKLSIGTENNGTLPIIESEHLLDINSIVEALKILDDLVSLTPLVEISEQEGNGIILKSDGIYYKLSTEYTNGILTIKVNDNIIGLHNMVMHSVVENAYYDSSTEEIIIVFRLMDGTSQNVKLNVTSLIREWDVDNNNPSKVVELTREEVFGDGPDRLSADVRISTKLNNILTKVGNSLYVGGIAKNIITDSGENLESALESISGKYTVFNTFEEYENIPSDTLKDKIIYIIDTGIIIYNNETFLNISDIYNKISNNDWYEENSSYTIYFVTVALMNSWESPINVYENPIKMRLYDKYDNITSIILDNEEVLELDITPYLAHIEQNYKHTTIPTKIYKITFETKDALTVDFINGDGTPLFGSHAILQDNAFYNRNARGYYSDLCYSYDGSLIEVGDFDY